MNVLAENRKAYFDYEILETFHAGMVLIGQEVKSIKAGRISLAGAYVVFRGDELYLIGAKVSPWQPKNAPRYDPERSRKLLLRKKELNYLVGKVREKGLTLIPLKVYSISGGKLKLEFVLGKGKRRRDKREIIKKREVEREIQRALRSNDF